MPETVGAAEWAVQRLTEATEEFEAIKAEVRGYVDQVRQWSVERVTTGRGAELVEQITFFENSLRAYARALRDASIDRKGEPRVKTIKLPSATLETKAAADRKAKFHVEDMDALVAWAEEGAPDLIERTVNVKKLKLLVVGDEDNADAVCTPDGELVPGVGFVWDEEPREPYVYIRINGPS